MINLYVHVNVILITYWRHFNLFVLHTQVRSMTGAL